MKCTVLRSASRDFTYVYLAEGTAFEDLPDALRSVFGAPEEVMSLDLDQRTSLAQEDIELVRRNLAAQGFHLQLPPSEDESGWLDLDNPPLGGGD